MHSLRPLTALGSDQARIDEFDGITVTEVPDVALASLAMRHGKKAGFNRACKTATGVAPPAPGSFANAGKMTVMSIGLDQWMVLAPHQTHETLATQLASTMKANASVTEQNDGWVCFDLTGPACVAVFERLCAANIRAMTAGSITRTAIEHLGCFLLCHKAGTQFRVIGPRSSAASLHHALITAVKSAL